MVIERKIEVSAREWEERGKKPVHPDFTSPPTKDATEEEKQTLKEAVDTCLKYGEWQAPQKAKFFVP